MASLSPRVPLLAGFRLLLVGGFLGLLAILGSAGWYSLLTLRRATLLDDDSSRLFIERSDALERIQTSTYELNSRLRDYLLDHEPGAGSRHRRQALDAWDSTSLALESFARLAPAESQQTLAAARAGLRQYWALAAPALEWDPARRDAQGFAFLSEQLSPARDRTLTPLEQLRRLNERRLRADLQLAESLIAALVRKLQLVLALGLLLASLLAGATWLRFLRLERLALERYQQTLDHRARLEALSNRLLDIQEEERRRISRELHDETGQTLSGLLVGLANLAADLPPHARDRAATLRASAEETLRSLRNLSLLLRPSMLDDLGLGPALRWQARETERLSGLSVEVDCDDAALDLPDDLRTAIYRIAQEALRNAARHSGAANVRVAVLSAPAALTLTIEDDGRGFDPKTTRGLGILGMSERIAHLQGSFEIDSAPGRGTRVRATLPPIP